MAACWPCQTLFTPSMNSRGSSLSIICAPGGSPPVRYCSRAWAPARLLRSAIFACPATIACASLTISPDCFFACSSARLYASVAAPALR